MTDIAIRVDGLSKSYRLCRAAGKARYRTLREELMQLPARLLGGMGAGDPVEEFLALRDVSFEVKRGEVLGVIGRNGAGKSTLLKIISRIVEPTEGGGDIYGRVGSLLEVGTGFHPELTGRENIFLSGAMLGMRRHEVREHFDEIVAFAGVERFVDTACKHYSSGMYMRLGFAVAAHLDTDIMIVDEVLAVGDAEFQKRCLGKMADVSRSGRTVLFVSHNMAAVRQLCGRGLVLERGRVAFYGEIEAAVAAYQDLFSAAGIGSYTCRSAGTGPAWIAGARLIGRSGRPVGCLAMSDPIELEVDVHCAEARRLALSLQVNEAGQSALLHLPSVDAGPLLPVETGCHRVRLTVPPVMFYPGVYGLKLTLSDVGMGAFDKLDQVDDLALTIEQDMEVCTRPLVRQAGVVFVRPKWQYLGRL